MTDQLSKLPTEVRSVCFFIDTVVDSYIDLFNKLKQGDLPDEGYVLVKELEIILKYDRHKEIINHELIYDGRTLLTYDAVIHNEWTLVKSSIGDFIFNDQRWIKINYSTFKKGDVVYNIKDTDKLYRIIQLPTDEELLTSPISGQSGLPFYTYRALYGNNITFRRPQHEFEDGRFIKVKS